MASKSKGIGGFLKAQASSKIKATTEEELRSKGAISPEDVLGLSKPCKSKFCQPNCRKLIITYSFLPQAFLCKLSDNIYNIEFVGFKLRDLETNTVLVETEKPADAPKLTGTEDDSVRTIIYEFSDQFLRLKTVGAT